MDLALVFKALSFAAKHHREQRRKGSGEPYVNHLIDVAALLVGVAGVDDAEEISAAVLHDTIEDTGVSGEDIERAFGRRVREMVEALTDDKRLPKDERKRLQVEHMASAGPEVRRIKLADHCSNVVTLPDDWSTKRKAEYLAWSERVASVCAGTNDALDAEYRQRLARALANVG